MIRSTEKQAMESKTNVIDRTIANLMFCKMDLNIQRTLAAEEINTKQEVIGMAGSQNHHSNQPHIRHFCQAMLAGEGCEVEVPTLS